MEIFHLIQAKHKLTGSEGKEELSSIMAAHIMLGAKICHSTAIEYDQNMKPAYIIVQFLPSPLDTPFSKLPQGMQWVITPLSLLEKHQHP